MRFQNKIALITGAALGYKKGGPSIGGAIAIKLAAEGAKVVVVDLNKEAGQLTVNKIHENEGEAVFMKIDVTNSREIKRGIQAIKKKFGRLDFLVNCAASYEGDIFHNVVDTPEEDWMNIFNVNLHGYYRMAKYAIPLMLENRGGSIVNISSIAAYNVVPNFSVYPVTKAAINGLTQVLAIDHAPEIRTNAICPGFVRIANSEGGRSPKELKKWHDKIAKTYPAKRLCKVDEIASVAAFLLSDEASYINGECLKVDSGRFLLDNHDY